VGYIVANIKDIHMIKTGDIIVEKGKPVLDEYVQYEEVKPFVFAGIYPMSTSDYEVLKMALEKYNLTDASFQYRNINSDALGPGFHCGFLGSLHLEIVKERLEKEYGQNLIVTVPNVVYLVKKKGEDAINEVDNPARFPAYNELDTIQEPYVKSMIITPTPYLSNVVELCKGRRGTVVEIKQLDSHSTMATFELPLAEIIVGFYDSLKSVSKGYASFDYEHIGFKMNELVKMEVLVNGDVVDTFAYIVHVTKVQHVSRKILEILRETIPRQMYDLALQISVEGKIVARDDIRAIRKDVIAKCYGGDITRKRKLLEKQKEGKKRMKQFGKVEIPQETFLGLLKINRD
jgi:GTP-binding protein LepA